MRQVEVGWRAVRDYSGASFDEIAQAIAEGELRCQIRVERRDLNAWMRARLWELAGADIA